MARILFLTERYAPDVGGVSASATRISRALAANHRVDVVAWTRTLPAGQVAHDADASVYRVGRFREWDATMPHTLNLLDWLHSAEPFDLVWGHYATLAGFLAVWFAKLNGARSLVSIRGNDLDREAFPPGDFARLRWTLENATLIASVTADLARKAAALTGRGDVRVLPNAVDHATFAPDHADSELRARLGIRADEAVLGFAGELREKKGLTHLLAAHRAVRERRAACLLIVGDVRPSEMPKLLQAIGPEPLETQRIIITGQLTTPAEVAAHLRLCDAYLQPSLWDGMPNALLEAMSAGCGCIASDAGGIPEMITPGVDGIVLPRWQLHRLGEAILEWLDAPAVHRDRIRHAARKTILNRFTFLHEHKALTDLTSSL